MSIFFSAKELGFYDAGIHGDNMPGAVVPVSRDDYQRLLDEQQAGRVLAADSGGNPITTDQPESARLYVERKQIKRAGIDYKGVSVSLNEENQNGIASVLAGAELAAEVGHSMFPITFNAMTAAGVQAVPLNSMDELKAFALAFMAARQQFFQ